MKLNAFSPLRPPAELVSTVASPPYDVIDSDEARRMAAGNPKSFLHIIKPEIDLPDTMDAYDDRVYAKAAENFEHFQQNGWLRRESEAGIYLYRQSFREHSQTGVVAVCHTEDYERDVIKKHEKTLRKKEDDRTRHVATLKANAGPVFLMVRAQAELKALMAKEQEAEPDVDFHSPDQVRHTVWKVVDVSGMLRFFHELPNAYVADGHHRSASAARCAKEFADANPRHTGEENYNWFLSVLFPADELQVLPYNRLVKGLNGETPDSLLTKIKGAGYGVTLVESGEAEEKGEVRMFMDGKWYQLIQRAEADADPVSSLDVSILQNRLLGPVLGIEDPRTDSRIRFKGGFDCLDQMTQAVNQGHADVAFSLYPTGTEEIMAVADAGLIMPPKSTWFEPKLRSGLFVHTL
ncbi:MAG: DUF1015 domain-containing protein [Verrucomicrobia bacterium]|nr:DUF1015 domain-containing protein [Verrucomicrobiota bacterium]MCH8512099.1 DUF1015 domain-containing protein [Kiritimatiellia bacterium]